MATARTDSFNAAISLSLENRLVRIQDVMERTDGDVSERTVRRALKEAENFGWLQKRASRANTWERGQQARRYFHKKNVEGYPDGEELPIMYFVADPTKDTSFLKGENVLVSAGASWTATGPKFRTIDTEYGHVLLDSGGYQAAVYFKDEYPYSPRELHEYGDTIGADVVFGMDWACEDADVLAAQTNTPVDEIAPWQDRLKWSLEDQIKQYEHYKNNRYDHEFRPVVQGHDPKNFTEFAKRLKESDMPTECVGVGTVCKRSENDEILEVVKRILDVLPDAELHLFGATLNIWKDGRFRDKFASSDSAAWMYHDPKDTGNKYPNTTDARIRAYKSYKDKVENSVARQGYRN